MIGYETKMSKKGMEELVLSKKISGIHLPIYSINIHHSNYLTEGNNE